MKYYSRDIFCLSDQEIIRLVDHIFDRVAIDFIAHSIYESRPSLTRELTYRKIEVRHAYYDWAYAVIVTMKFSELDTEVRTGFILIEEGGPGDNKNYELDFSISSIKGFFKPFEDVVLGKDTDKEYNINFDFSGIRLYVRKFYNFLRKDLQMWNSDLHYSKYILNPKLMGLYSDIKSEIIIIEELFEGTHEERLNVLCK